MKKLSKLSLGILVIFVTSVIVASTVWGYNAIRKVDATANDNIKIYYDGQLKEFTESDGSKISPVIINGRTYLPLRAVADLAGMGVEWNGTTQSIKLSSNSGVPYKDNTPVVTQSATNSPAPVSTPVSSAPVSTSKSSATLKDPVKLGETYSWSATEKVLDSSASANYSFTVKKVEPITVDEITKLGFKINSDPTKVDYVMVTAEQTVSNASIQSGEQYLYLAFYRDIFGSKTPTGKSVIGGTDYGFEGSMMDSARNATKDSNGLTKKILPGQVESYKYEGKIILPLTKGEENYLVITKDASLDYSDRYIYFRLK